MANIVCYETRSQKIERRATSAVNNQNQKSLHELIEENRISKKRCNIDKLS
jgi:hypothetical protein